MADRDHNPLSPAPNKGELSEPFLGLDVVTNPGLPREVIALVNDQGEILEWIAVRLEDEELGTFLDRAKTLLERRRP